MKTVVWNVNGFAPASAKAFAHPRQVQSRHFLLSGNQDPVSAFRSRASLVLEPGQTPGGRGRHLTLARREPSPMRYGMGIGPFDDEGRLILLEYNVATFCF